MPAASFSSSVTLSLVPEAAGGPFVFWGDLPRNARLAKSLGFDAIEVFAPSASFLKNLGLIEILDETGLRLAALGTGAGWVLHKLTLTHSDSSIRIKSRAFISELIELAADYRAPAIIGSMQGRFDGSVSKPQAFEWLRDALNQLGNQAAARGTLLFFEPLNRYETNLVNRIDEGVALLESLETDAVRLLVDLFHANIEEVSTSEAIKKAGRHVGHIHFVDSNRRAAGWGQMDFKPIIEALKAIGYQGYLSAEAQSHGDGEGAAKQTLTAYNTLV